MMCLGWSNPTVCRDMQQEQVVSGVNSGSAAPNITWFWLAAAVAVFAGMNGRKSRTAAA